MIEVKRILFPTDFSEHSEHAWTYALAFAKEFGAELHLIHVVAAPPHVGEAYVTYDPKKLLEAMTAEANAQLDRMVEVARDAGLTFHRLVVTGVDFREIIEAARTREVDLIVMATHGRTGLAHALMGSVAEKVVRKAPCPVLTIKHPKMRFEMP